MSSLASHGWQAPSEPVHLWMKHFLPSMPQELSALKHGMGRLVAGTSPWIRLFSRKVKRYQKGERKTVLCRWNCATPELRCGAMDPSDPLLPRAWPGAWPVGTKAPAAGHAETGPVGIARCLRRHVSHVEDSMASSSMMQRSSCCEIGDFPRIENGTSLPVAPVRPFKEIQHFSHHAGPPWLQRGFPNQRFLLKAPASKRGSQVTGTHDQEEYRGHTQADGDVYSTLI